MNTKVMCLGLILCNRQALCWSCLPIEICHTTCVLRNFIAPQITELERKVSQILKHKAVVLLLAESTGSMPSAWVQVNRHLGVEHCETHRAARGKKCFSYFCIAETKYPASEVTGEKIYCSSQLVEGSVPS